MKKTAMKLIKALIIILIVSFSFSAVFPQDAVSGTDNNAAVTTGSQNQEGNAGVSSADKAESQNIPISGVVEKKETVRKQVVESSKKSAAPVKSDKTPSDTVKPVESNGSGNELLLFINDGNYKYKRIPDIKLAEKEPAMAEQNQQAGSGTSTDNFESGEKGFFGLSRNTSDIVAKGGILLLILVVFTIYKVRSRGHGRRTSSSVMNSYRK